VSATWTRRVPIHVGILLGAVVFGRALGAIRGEAVPFSAMVLALTFGCVNALFAIGLVLIYRATRIINFAHAGFGGVGGVVMLLLANELRWPYAVAVVAGLLTALLLGGLCELFFVRRFAKAPRLVLTVATIGIGQLLLGVSQVVPLFFGPADEVRRTIFAGLQSPFSHDKFEWFPVIFTGDHIALLAVTAVVLLALAAFLRFSSIGIAVRAAAENEDKASLLGINTKSLSTLVWVLAAGLSGIAAVMQVPLDGITSAAATGVGSGLVLRALAAAVIAKMENLPLAVTTAIAIAILEQSVFLTFNRTNIVDVAMLAVILGGLLVQRKRIARGEDTGVATWTATEEIRPVPKELAQLPTVRKAARRLAIAGAIVALAYPWVASPSQTNTGSLFVIYGIVAVSLVILIGWGGQVSLGQFAFVAVGALAGGALTTRWHVWFPLALVLASLVGAGVAVLLGLPALRIKGLFLAVTTLGFSVVTATVLLNDDYFGWLRPRQVNRPTFAFINTEDSRSFYYLCVLCLLLAVFLAKGLRQSRTGRVLIAMRDNERAAQSFAVNLVRTRLATFALSGFLASMAGVLFANHQHAVNQQAFLPDQSIQMFIMAVIGGLGSVTGVLLGPLYIGLVKVFLPPELQLLAGAVGVLLVLLFIPGGLGSLAYGLRDAFLRRVAIRNRIFVPSLLADYRTDAHMTRLPLAPKYDVEGQVEPVEARYRLPSRIGLAGVSQAARRWSF
jgi:branched-chain amino acid transport system permease protein